MYLLIRQFSKLSKSIPLRLVFILPFILQISIAVGLVGWLSIQNGNQAVDDVASQLRNETMTRIRQYLETYITTPQEIDQLNANAAQLNQLNFHDLPSIEYYLWRQIQVFDLANEIKIGTAQGEFIAVERVEDNSFNGKISGKVTGYINTVYQLDRTGQPAKLLLQLKNYDARTRSWYRAAVEAGKATWGKVYKRPNSPRPMIPFSLPVYDTEHNLLCVASVDFSLYGISKYLNSLKIGRSGETFIIERTGLLIGSSTAQPIFNIQGQQVQRFKATDSQAVLTRSAARALLDRFGDFAHVADTQQLDFEINGQRQFLQVAPLQEQGLDWLIVVVVPEADFMDRITANTHITILLCLAAFGIATGLGIVTARWITRPILQLSRASRAIAQGELDQTVRVQGATEINVLAQSFNQMAQQLQESFAQLARTNDELELRVVQRTAALQSSEAKFAAAFRSSPNPLAITTLSEGQFIEVNESFRQIYDYNSGEIIGRTSLELNLFQTLEHRVKITEILQAKKAFYNQEMELCVRSGAIKTLLLSAELIMIDATPCILWVGYDITERKQIEAELQRSEAKYRRIFENSQVGIFQARLEDGLLLVANQHLSNMLGYDSPADLVGRMHTMELYVEPSLHAKILEAAHAHHKLDNFETQVRKRDGSLLWVLASIRLNEVGYVEAVISDISDRKLAEAASVLEERNRMAREIHDTLAQAFTSIIIHLEAAALKLTTDQKATQALLKTGRDLARSGLAEARRSVEALRPMILENCDLYSALQKMAEQMFSHTKTQVVCNRVGSAYPLESILENNLFRIGQEALNNVLKHGRAREIWVTLLYEPSLFTLKIEDNGQGFVINNSAVSGFGLLGITERAKCIGAKFTIQSELEQGTAIIVSVDRWQP